MWQGATKHPIGGVLAEVRDPWGRIVILTEKGMAHAVRGHPEMDGHELLVQTAIESAEARCRGVKDGRLVPGREVLFRRGLGPGRWVKVVVAYDGLRGEVITALADRDGPRHDLRI